MDALIVIIGIVWGIFSLTQKNQKKQKMQANRHKDAPGSRPTVEDAKRQAADQPAQPATAQRTAPARPSEWQRMLGGSVEAVPGGDMPKGEVPKRSAKAHAKPAQPAAQQPRGEAQTMLPPRPASIAAMQTAMASAAEGEDPCHEDMLAPQVASRRASSWDAADDDALARDLLRGVIFAEILTRPADQRKLRMR